MQYWARSRRTSLVSLTSTDANGIGSAIVQIKNIMLWHDNGERGSSRPATAPGRLSDLRPVVHDAGGHRLRSRWLQFESASRPVLQGFYADGQWHRWTIYYKPNTSRGRATGLRACGLTARSSFASRECERAVCEAPSGRVEAVVRRRGARCALFGDDYGVGALEWGANRTDNSGIPFTMAIDDFKWWVIK